MSRDGYERWEDRPDGQDPDSYDPRDPRRSRRAVRPGEQWSGDSGPQDAYNPYGSHRRPDPNAEGTYRDGTYGDGAYGDGAHGDGARGDGTYGDSAHGESAYGDTGYGDAGYGDGGNAYGDSGRGSSRGGTGFADPRYAGNGYSDAGYGDNGYAGYGGSGQPGYDRADGYDRGAGFGRSAGHPDAGYSEQGYPESGTSGARYPGSPDGVTYGGPAARDGGPGDAGYESRYRNGGSDAESYPDASYPANGYQPGGYGTAATPGRPESRDPYGPKDPYGAKDPYAAPDPYGARDAYGRAGSPGHTDPRGQTDPFSRSDPSRGQTDAFARTDPSGGKTDPFSRTDPSRGQTDPFARTDPAPPQTDPFGRTDPRGQAGAPGSAERYAPADGYEDGTVDRSGPPASPFASGDGYGELGSRGRQDSYGGPAARNTGDPFGGRDPRGPRGGGPAGYDGSAGNEYGGGYDEHDFDPAPGHDSAPAQGPDYARRGDRDESYGWQGPVDDSGVTRRRQREPEDELDADSARHNGFFRGFGGGDEVGHRPPKRRRSRAGMVAMVVIIIFLGGIVGAGAYGYHWYAARHADWTGSAGSGTVIVKVPQGGTAYGMSTVLVKDGVIAAAAPFRTAAEQSGKSSLLEPGYFRLHKHMGAALAWALIINPKARVQTTVAVPDGMRASKVIALLAAKTGIPLSKFQAALQDTSALGLPTWAKGNPEGFLWPATYNVQPGTSAQAILQMMVKQANTELATIDLAAAAKRDQFSEYEVIVVASLLEGEVPPQYYAKVARVIDNRLNQVPPWDLGLDSTVAYAVNKYVYNLSQSDLNVNSPYNTFKHAGVPPGPIDSPDAAAIQAVLHPAQGPWLYFVTVNKKGLTLFTTSSAQFDAWANLAKQNGV
jgi:UPF0755 protein